MTIYNDVARIIAGNPLRITLVEMVVKNFLGPKFMGSVVQQIDFALAPPPGLETADVSELNGLVSMIVAGMTDSKVRPFEGGNNYGYMALGYIRASENVGTRTTSSKLDIKPPLSGPSLLPEDFDPAGLVQEDGKTSLTRNLNIFLFPSKAVAGFVKQTYGGYFHPDSLDMGKMRELMRGPPSL